MQTTNQKGRAFEERIATLLGALGFSVSPTLRASGVKTDMIARISLPMGPLFLLVECKDWSTAIGVDEIKLFYAEVDAIKRNCPYLRGCFVSTSGFTEDAARLCEDLNIWHTTPSMLESSLVNWKAHHEQLRCSYLTEGLQRGVPLHATYVEQDACVLGQPGRAPFKSVFDAWLESSTTPCLLVLADYGTGKTSMTMKYAAELTAPRIAVRIPLTNRGVIHDLRALLLDHVAGHARSPLTPSAIDYFLETQPLVLFLDGLDELGVPFPSGSTINRLLNITDMIGAHPALRLVITGRTHYFRDETEISHLGQDAIEIAAASGTEILRRTSDLSVCYLLPFDDKGIAQYLEKRRPSDHRTVYKALMRSPLLDLARRPLLCDMILDSADVTKQLTDWTTQASLYSHYTGKWLSRDEHRGSLGRADKVLLTEALAMRLSEEHRSALHWRELTQFFASERVRSAIEETPEAIAHEMRTASFLIANASGEFGFAHNSFQEFFLASYLCRHMGADILGSLRRIDLSELTITFLTHMVSQAPRGIDQLQMAFDEEERGKRDPRALANLTFVFAELGRGQVLARVGHVIATTRGPRRALKQLKKAFAALLLKFHESDDCMPVGLIVRSTHTIRNPITDEVIIVNGNEVTRDHLRALAKLGLDWFSLSVEQGPQAYSHGQ